MWIEYNPNPAQPRAGDCAVRAVAKALNLDWESAYAKIAVNGFQPRIYDSVMRRVMNL